MWPEFVTSLMYVIPSKIIPAVFLCLYERERMFMKAGYMYLLTLSLTQTLMEPVIFYTDKVSPSIVFVFLY